ncbi:response regulator transcription factor [Hyphococcus flavus]|uniref:Response regulator transcription factor n=1 Tax=Hyphococcus flavus TaxID=1866326 RepID=A0AAE9ZCN9_9PROT|nr:response regulator transcription factor [Hyphococcus flavus]WDI30153.1 response regulator transcription factor [Hyphococcus flavus]
MTLTVVIADDHAIVRQGVKSILASLSDFSVVGEAENGVELVALVKRHTPALVFADIAMPYAGGLEAVDEIRRWSPNSRLIILTGLTSRGLAAQAHAASVDGLFLKSDPPEELAQAIPKIISGEPVYSTAIEKILSEAHPSDMLTARELQVLRGISNGETNARIAERLGVSAYTVDKHRTNMMRKLKVHSAAELLALALRDGLLDSASTL